MIEELHSRLEDDRQKRNEIKNSSLGIAKKRLGSLGDSSSDKN